MSQHKKRSFHIPSISAFALQQNVVVTGPFEHEVCRVYVRIFSTLWCFRIIPYYNFFKLTEIIVYLWNTLDLTPKGKMLVIIKVYGGGEEIWK